jgi:hypothetical protein
MQRRVGAVGRPQQRQPVVVGHQLTARRPEGHVTGTRQGDAKRLPIKATVQQSKVARVDIGEEALVLESGQVERQCSTSAEWIPVCAAARLARRSTGWGLKSLSESDMSERCSQTMSGDSATSMAMR